MKRTPMILAALISFAVIVLTTAAHAQMGMHWKGSGGWGPGSQYGRMYNPTTVETISGEVQRVDLISPMKGMSQGVHLAVKTDQGPISVQLGPAWFIENQDMKIQPGDKVEITGSRIVFQGKPAIIAKEVKKGNEVLALRDQNGFPVWSGMGRGGRMMGQGSGMMPGAASGGTGTSGSRGMGMMPGAGGGGQ